MTEIACEGTAHSIAFLLQSRCASRGYMRTLKDKRSGTITEASLTFHQVHDVRGTTLHYLQAQLTNNQDREELLRLAEELFVEEELV